MGQATTVFDDYGDDSPVNDTYKRTFEVGMLRRNVNPTTLATGLIGWYCKVGGHPGTWEAIYGIAGSLASVAPSSVLVAVVDYDNLGGLAVAPNDTTAMFGYAQTTGVIATDMTTALTAAKLKPFKTLERVGQLLPRWGNHAFLVILVRPRASKAAYRNIANTADQSLVNVLGNVSGWQRILFRASLNFANDTNDKIVCGYQQVTGTFTANAGGYNATTGSTARTLVCQKAGGGAPGFPAESAGVSAISAKRVRFRSTTTTTALQNTCGLVWKNTTGNLVLGSDLPATPAVGDIFDIEEPTLVLGSSAISFGKNQNMVIAGFRALSATWIGPGNLTVSGVETTLTATAQNLTAFTADNSYPDETGTARALGIGMFSGMDATGANRTTVTGVLEGNVHASGSLGTGQSQFVNNGRLIIGRRGCNYRGGVEFISSNSTVSSFSGTQGIEFGNSGSSTESRARISSASNIAGISLVGVSGGKIIGVDASGCTVPVVAVIAARAGVSIDDIVSSDSGNLDVVLNLNGDSLIAGNIILVARVSGGLFPITATATVGDIRMADGQICDFAGLANQNHRDGLDNIVVGTGGILI